MARNHNTTTTGSSFSKDIIEAVWKKAKDDPGFTLFKKDSCGASIFKSEYGKITIYGWEIDHIKPIAKGGTDGLTNLQPLHWGNNRRKSDDWPEWECTKTS